jgi:hypothetical protein
MAQVRITKIPKETEEQMLKEQKRTGQSLASIARLALVDRYDKKGK